MNIKLKSSLASIFVSIVVVFGLVVSRPVFADVYPPLNVMIYTHTNDSLVGGAYINSYSAFSSIPGVTVIYRDITGMSLNQYQAQLAVDMTSGQNLLIYGGHGSLTDLSTDGVSFPRNVAMTSASEAAAAAGGTVTGVVESCGSGNVCSVNNLAGSGNLEGVYTAANPGDYGYVSSSGGPWYANFGEEFKSTLSHFGDGTSLDPDVNGDGVLTQGELADALYGENSDKRSQIPDPDKPFAFKDAATAEKYLKYTECIIARPGQVDKSYSPSGSTAGVAVIEYKPTSISGYENRTSDPVAYPVKGQVQDDESHESQINFDLRRLGSSFIEQQMSHALNLQIKTDGLAKRIVLLPTKAQAQEFVKSLNGNSDAQGSYTLNGVKVDVGKHYLANHPSPSDKVVFDNSCTPREWVAPSPKPSPSSSPNANGNNPGGSPQQAPATGNPLDALLASMLQSLLGGPQNQAQNGQSNGQQQNNGTGTGTSSATPACAINGIAPVCGSDGKTYTNSCYLKQYGAIQVSSGQCATPGVSPAPTPDNARLFSQLATSGIPQAVLSTITNYIASIFSNVSGGEVMVR